MQNKLLKRIVNLTAKKEIAWSIKETQINNCIRNEGKGEKCDFVIMEFTDKNNSFVGYYEKDKEDLIVIEACQKDIDMFIKIIKSTKIKEKMPC